MDFAVGDSSRLANYRFDHRDSDEIAIDDLRQQIAHAKELRRLPTCGALERRARRAREIGMGEQIGSVPFVVVAHERALLLLRPVLAQ